jgi:hypothetical protein
MEKDLSFKEIFYSLSELLGESRRELDSCLGISNEISEDENRAYIFYPDTHAYIGVKDNNVFRIVIPVENEKGTNYDGPKDFFTLDGVKLDMTMDEIVQQWGEPISRNYYGLEYDYKVTKSGKTFKIGFGFEEDKDFVQRLKHFTAFPYSIPSFEDDFLESCQLLGLDSKTLLNEIGEPDSKEVDEDGKTYLYYIKKDILFTIPRDYSVTEFVAAPLNPTNQKKGQAFYKFKGLNIGITRDEIISKWGNPSGAEDYVWSYNNLTSITKNGYHFEIRLLFDTNNPNILKGFGGMLYDYGKSSKLNEKTKSGCFIATACYGNYDAMEVRVLRNYRDNVLIKNKIGRFVVGIYYLISPPIARLLDNSDSVKAIIRKNVLTPIVSKIKRKKHFEKYFS